jgi:hypothetical protein
VLRMGRTAKWACLLCALHVADDNHFFDFSSFSHFLFFSEKAFANGWAWHTANFAVCLTSSTRQSRC